MKHIYLIIIILTTLSVRGQDTLLLTSKCSYYESELSGSKTCYKYVYNDAGQLTISTFSIGEVEKIRTENIYNELGQKKIKIEFSQTDRTKKDTVFYTYKADTIYIKRNSFKQLYEVKYSLKGEFLGGWGGNFDQYGNLLSISKTVCEFDKLNGISRIYVVSYNSINDMRNHSISDGEIIFDRYFTYDTLGRKIQEILLIPVNSYKHFEYDKKGRLTKETTVKSKTETNKVLYDTITNLFIYKETRDSLYTTCQNSIFTDYHVKITPLNKIQSGPSYVLFFDKKGNEVILKRKVTTIYNEQGYPIEQKEWSRPEEYYDEYSNKWTTEPTLGIEITKFEYITISKNKMSDFNYNWDD